MPFCTQTGKLITITLPGGQPCPPGTYSFIVMRIVVLLAALLASQILSAQSTDSVRHGPSLSLQLGFRVHDNRQEYASAAGERKMLSSPMIGLMLQMPRMPLRVGAQVDFDVLLVTPIIDRQLVNYAAGSVSETWIEYQLQAYYDFSKWTLGLGTYWKWRENFLDHAIPDFFIREYYGIQFSAGVPLNWLDLEFRTKMVLEPMFAALGTSQYSLLLIYNLDKNRLRREGFKTITVNGLIGGRFFSTQNIELLAGEYLFPIGTSVLAGIEVMHNKSGLSLSAERDWWLAINGGSFRRDVKGYINTAFVSAGYHKQLKNNRFLRFKLGWAAIVDYDKRGKLGPDTRNRDKLGTYQVKGVGAAVSYELFKSTDVELRHVFPVWGDRLFNPLRTSVGLIYRYNPSE